MDALMASWWYFSLFFTYRSKNSSAVTFPSKNASSISSHSSFSRSHLAFSRASAAFASYFPTSASARFFTAS